MSVNMGRLGFKEEQDLILELVDSKELYGGEIIRLIEDSGKLDFGKGGSTTRVDNIKSFLGNLVFNERFLIISDISYDLTTNIFERKLMISKEILREYKLNKILKD